MPYSEDHLASATTQAKELREQARKGGLRFEAYLPPALADWILDMIEKGVFISPSEATFAILREHRELEPHRDLREELMHRRLQSALDDTSPTFTWDEVRERLERELATKPPAASWSGEFLKSEN